MPPKPRLCLDTNIILLDATNVLVLSRKYDVCIPETVIDELDNKKSKVLSLYRRDDGQWAVQAIAEGINGPKDAAGKETGSALNQLLSTLK